MGKLNKIILCAMLTIAGAQSWADSTADFLPPPPPKPATGPGSGVNESPGINPQANQAQSKESGASAMNMLAAAALFAGCLASNPPNMPLCMMGALAAMQSGHDAGAADMSGMTALASTKEKANPAFGDGKGQYTDPTVNAGMKALKDGGYTVTDTGIRHPDGSTTPASAFDSPAAMAAAGIDQKTIDSANKALAGVDASGATGPKVSSVGVSEGGGGGGAASGGNYDANGNSYNPFRLSALQKSQMVAGKTVMFDGEPIGVKGQNLFDMVHVAYERKAQSNHFLGDNGDGLRAPASVEPTRPAVKKIK